MEKKTFEKKINVNVIEFVKSMKEQYNNDDNPVLISKIDFSSQNIQKIDVDFLLKEILQIRTFYITNIDLSHNLLDDDSISYFSDFFDEHNFLKELNLSSNKIGKIKNN